jgi:hypothetical protein
MHAICHRQDKSIGTYADLSTDELYLASHLSDKQWFVHLKDGTPFKRATDPWPDQNESDTFKTYADYFAVKYAHVSISFDACLAQMKGMRTTRINYLQETSKKLTSHNNESSSIYLPIELLRYAPINRNDRDLIYRLPSLLTRMSQLYRIEKLRQMLADGMRIYSVGLLNKS